MIGKRGRRIMTILITGAGATPALCAAESLKLRFGKNITIIGIDANPYAVGIYLKRYFDLGRLVPSVAKDPKKYLAIIKQIIKCYKVDFILPATDIEIVFLKKLEHALQPAEVISSDLRTLKICTDKWLTYKTLRSSKLMVESWIDAKEVSFPCVVKPRKSQGSKNVYTAYNKIELGILSKRVRQPIFQKRLSSEEYTIDCLYDQKGRLLGAVPRRRVVVGGGTAIITETVRDVRLMDLVQRLGEIVSFKGPINVQCIKNKIIEINPRIGGASILSTYSGMNIPAISLLLWKGSRVKKWYPYEDKVLTRYFSSVCFNKCELKTFN